MVILEIAARKVRVSLPDQPNLVLQSFYQANDKPSPGQPLPLHHCGIQQFCMAQHEAEETSNNNDINRNSCPNVKPAALLDNSRETAKSTYSDIISFTDDDLHASLTTMYTKTRPDSADNSSTLTRIKSSPHLSVLPSLLGSPQKDSRCGSDVTSCISNPHSCGNRLEVSENKTSASDSSVNKVLNKPLDAKMPLDAVNKNSSYGSGFGFLSQTRRFGSWLTKATEGGKVQVTRKDLNVLAPNSF